MKLLISLIILNFLGQTSSFATDELAEKKRLILKYELEMAEEFLANKDKIIGMELLLANPNPNVSQEKFGHTMLRFVLADGKWFRDFVVSFVTSSVHG